MGIPTGWYNDSVAEAKSAQTRSLILCTAMNTIRERGYAATGIDEICRRVGITKGGFFHYFKDKQQMAVEAAEYFSSMADQLFRTAPFNQLIDPVERLFGYIDFRRQIMQGETYEYTCLLGTLAQEIHTSHPPIQEACGTHIDAHIEFLTPLFQAALDARDIAGQPDARSLAEFSQAAFQGGFILAKASGTPEPARRAADHLRRYLETIFTPLGDTQT